MGSPELEPALGPDLRVVSIFPEDGAGTDCPPEELECGVPLDVAIEVRFDRFLRPDTAIRQSFAIYTGDPENGVPETLLPTYDLVERVVTFAPPAGAYLRPNLLYTVELPVAVEPSDFGFRAFDGVPLANDTLLRFSFLTSNRTEGRAPSPETASCAELFGEGQAYSACGGCHDFQGFMGLDLSSPEGVAATAIRRVAHQTETGTSTGVVLETSPRFGVAMPLIDPGRPDNSYLMYKILVERENYRLAQDDPELCASEHRAAPDPLLCVPPPEEERERLHAWFLRGSGMPTLGDSASFLDRGRLRSLQAFIASGAECP